MTVNHPFKTLFAVPMTCDDCVKDISDALLKITGISEVEAVLQDQLVSIVGTAPPSLIVKTIQSTGRDAILRGSGNSNSAGVSILETYYEPQDRRRTQNDSRDCGSADFKDRYVRGLARMVQVAPSVTVIDLTIQGVAPGVYYASIRAYGNLEDGASTTGPIWNGGDKSGRERGYLGTISVGADGRGDAFLEKDFEVWEVIGHALVVSPVDEAHVRGKLLNDANTVVGVIARSAGVWDNDKTVCSCTGKTLWDERKDEVRKGIL